MSELESKYAEALAHTQQALEYMSQFGIKPGGQVRLFFPPESRQTEIDRVPYPHPHKQTVVYETEQGEFSAVGPYSGLPDYGIVRVEYVPGSWILELKSYKYYLMSWREIGIYQEDVTVMIYQDLMRHLADPQYLQVTTTYNIRGGIRTTCTLDSRQQ